MTIDWTALAIEMGCLRFHEDGTRAESGGTMPACVALEKLLGGETIANAVELILAGKPGGELAMSVLQHIRSWQAVEKSYQEYQRFRIEKKERAAEAVWLIVHIAHPRSVEWIPEFLSDPNVAGWGIGLLDQLLFRHQVDLEEVEDLLVLAEQHEAIHVQERAAFIREYTQQHRQ